MAQARLNGIHGQDTPSFLRLHISIRIDHVSSTGYVLPMRNGRLRAAVVVAGVALGVASQAMASTSASTSVLQSAPNPSDFASLSLYSEAYHPNATQSNDASPSFILAGK